MDLQEINAEQPRVSIVLCTYNRAGMVIRTIQAVLDQGDVDLELVIVDDGSTDETEAVLAEITDPRVCRVRRSNGGLCAARNSGIAVAKGRWIVFLDDDDMPSPGWLAALVEQVEDEKTGISCVGVRFVNENGEETGRSAPSDLGPTFYGVTALYLPGTFAVRRDIVEAAGGYAKGLGASHQFELFLRLVEQTEAWGLSVSVEPAPLLDMYRRPPNDRPVVNPRLLCDGNRWVLARHPLRFRPDRILRADFEAVVGVNAARLGDWRIARRYLARSLVSHPWSTRRVGRLGLVLLPALAQYAWSRERAWATHDPTEIGLSRQREPNEPDRELFLPLGYHENPPASSDSTGTPFWAGGMTSSDVRNQDPVYRIAAKLVRRRSWTPVVDVGCGTGHKLVRRVGAVTRRFVGADQPSAVALARNQFPNATWIEGDIGTDEFWSALDSIHPKLILCVDVIEHLEDPVALLHRLRALVGTAGRVLLSTPDRSRLERSNVLGPPTNPRHIREWTQDEFELLAHSVGFRVERAWHLYPRGYSLTRTEFNRSIYRALHLRRLPDPRSSMAFLLRRQ